jgi:hypothetical protein|tara:strand:- start:1419 stop:1544 length:126 start_codon:yes stop_codon:yes gene_type:complete
MSARISTRANTLEHIPVLSDNELITINIGRQRRALHVNICA